MPVSGGEKMTPNGSETGQATRPMAASSRCGLRSSTSLPGQVDAGAAAASSASWQGRGVYGIIGFGKLASVRIPADDLETLQRNIVLSHAAGTGEPMPVAVARLMMALKLASLAQGASGVRPQTIDLLQAMLANDVIPVVPAQGSVGASGDLAPLSHMTAAMIGVGECFTPHGRFPAKVAFVSHGVEPVTLGAKEGLALLNGTQFSTAYALAACSRRKCCSSGAGDGRALPPRRARSDTVRPAHHLLRRHEGQIETAARAARADGRQRHPRIAPHRRRARAGPLLPSLPAAGDGAALDVLRKAAAHAGRPKPTA